MPRVGRIAPGGVIYHVLNRGNGRRQLFLKDGDYLAFLKLLAEVRETVPIDLLAYFPVEQDRHLLMLLRYVEANALRAKLVRRAENWKWGSLYARERDYYPELLSAWPLDRPGNWAEIVNGKMDADDLEPIRTSIKRGRPYGSPPWVRQAAERLGLSFTLRPRGRPGREKA
ncbi:MAG TPA: hypothetical protein VFE47_19340 [Tepidisphaeraceae bacterium]|nr:hypothetical protein [Tepidisphaeraceae bacterium]